MPRGSGLALLLLAAVAVSVAAPSIGDPTHTLGGSVYVPEDDAEEPVQGNEPGNYSTYEANGSNESNESGAERGSDDRSLLARLGRVGAVAAVLGLLVLVAGVVLWRAGESVDPGELTGGRATGPPSADDDGSPPPAAVGRVAGEAADRLADADDVENEVYRAWREMTDLLDVPGAESTTPGEFAAAAVEAGVDADDAAVLTRIFERVRYGDEPVTDERVRRARAALRGVEAALGGGGTGTGVDGADGTDADSATGTDSEGEGA